MTLPQLSKCLPQCVGSLERYRGHVKSEADKLCYLWRCCYWFLVILLDLIHWVPLLWNLLLKDCPVVCDYSHSISTSFLGAKYTILKPHPQKSPVYLLRMDHSCHAVTAVLFVDYGKLGTLCKRKSTYLGWLLVILSFLEVLKIVFNEKKLWNCFISK